MRSLPSALLHPSSVSLKGPLQRTSSRATLANSALVRSLNHSLRDRAPPPSHSKLVADLIQVRILMFSVMVVEGSTIGLTPLYAVIRRDRRVAFQRTHEIIHVVCVFLLHNVVLTHIRVCGKRTPGQRWPAGRPTLLGMKRLCDRRRLRKEQFALHQRGREGQSDLCGGLSGCSFCRMIGLAGFLVAGGGQRNGHAISRLRWSSPRAP